MNREAARAKRKADKRRRRIARKRDKEVTAEYGQSGHRQCGKKARYHSEGEALDKAMRYMLMGAPKLRAYPCRLCGGWHLTSKEKL